MSLFGSIWNGVKAVGRKTLTVVTYPVVKPTEIVMNAVIQNILNSVLKGFIGTLVAALAAFASAPAQSNDPITVFIWGLVITGVHALQTLIQHLTGTTPPVTQAQVAKAIVTTATAKK